MYILLWEFVKILALLGLAV